MPAGSEFLAAFGQWAGDPRLTFPDAARQQVRLALLDTLACMLAGAGEPQTRKAAAMAAQAAPGTVMPITGGSPLAVTAAALVNGTAAHAIDFDDYEAPASTHPSAVILGALLALSEQRSVTLGQLIEAYLVGYEAIVRTGEALSYAHYMAGWHATSTIGPLGAAAATARLLGLQASGIGHAVALATSMSAGLKLQFGSDAKAIHAGLAARGGLEAGLLAGAGITAGLSVFDGPGGFLDRYGTPDSPGFARPLARLARIPAIIEHPLLRKPWPSCAYTHRVIEAAAAIAARPGFDARTIARGALRLPEPFARVIAFDEPATTAQARFSGLFCVAATLIDGTIGPQSFTPASLARPDLRALMGRLVRETYDPGPGLEDMSPSCPDTLTLELTSGRVETATIGEVRGGPARPLGQEDLVLKLRACGGSAVQAEAILTSPLEQPFQWSSLRGGPA